MRFSSLTTVRRILQISICCLFAALIGNFAFAQNGGGHPLYPAGLPTGAVAQGTLLQPLPMQGHFQPCQLTMPEGCVASFTTGDQFLSPQPSPTQVGLLVGHIYRFQITEIPYNAGRELYPTLEIVNRLYPPQGKEWEFPVEIEITQDDLETALSGRLVTRVIYLEDPLTALPTTGETKSSLAIDAKEDQTPYQVASGLGRPMVILRMGNRQPMRDGSDMAFYFDSAPWVSGMEQSIIPQNETQNATLNTHQR